MNDEQQYQKYLNDGGSASFEEFLSVKSMLPEAEFNALASNTDSEKKKNLQNPQITETTIPSPMTTALPISNDLELNPAQEQAIAQAQADNSLGLDTLGNPILQESPLTETASSGLGLSDRLNTQQGDYSKYGVSMPQQKIDVSNPNQSIRIPQLNTRFEMPTFENPIEARLYPQQTAIEKMAGAYPTWNERQQQIHTQKVESNDVVKNSNNPDITKEKEDYINNIPSFYYETPKDQLAKDAQYLKENVPLDYSNKPINKIPEYTKDTIIGSDDYDITGKPVQSVDDYNANVIKMQNQGLVTVIDDGNGYKTTDNGRLLYQITDDNYLKDTNKNVAEINKSLEQQRIDENYKVSKDKIDKGWQNFLKPEEQTPLQQFNKDYYSQTGKLLTTDELSSANNEEKRNELLASGIADKRLKENPNLNYQEEYDKALKQINPFSESELTAGGRNLFSELLQGVNIEENTVQQFNSKGYNASDFSGEKLFFQKLLSDPQMQKEFGKWWYNDGGKDLFTGSETRRKANFNTQRGRYEIMTAFEESQKNEDSADFEVNNNNIAQLRLKIKSAKEKKDINRLNDLIGQFNSTIENNKQIEEQQINRGKYTDERIKAQAIVKREEDEFQKNEAEYDNSTLGKKGIISSTIGGAVDAGKDMVLGIPRLLNQIVFKSDATNYYMDEIGKPSTIFNVKQDSMFEPYENYKLGNKTIQKEKGYYFEITNEGKKPIQLSSEEKSKLQFVDKGTDFSAKGLFGSVSNNLVSMAGAEFAGAKILGFSSKVLGRTINEASKVYGAESGLVKSLQYVNKLATNPTNNGVIGWTINTLENNYQDAVSKGLRGNDITVSMLTQSMIVGLASKISPDVKFFREAKTLEEGLLKALTTRNKNLITSSINSFTNSIAKNAIKEIPEEIFQENMERIGQTVGEIIESVKTGKNQVTTISFDEIKSLTIETAITTAILGGLSGARQGNNFEYKDKIYDISKLDRRGQLSLLANISNDNIYNEFKTKWGVDAETMDKVKANVDTVKKYINEIPDKENYTLNGMFSAGVILQDIEKLQKQKETSNPIFHQEIDIKIEEKKKEIKDVLEKNKYDLNAKTGEELITTETTETPIINEQTPQSTPQQETVQTQEPIAETTVEEIKAPEITVTKEDGTTNISSAPSIEVTTTNEGSTELSNDNIDDDTSFTPEEISQFEAKLQQLENGNTTTATTTATNDGGTESGTGGVQQTQQQGTTDTQTVSTTADIGGSETDAQVNQPKFKVNVGNGFQFENEKVDEDGYVYFDTEEDALNFTREVQSVTGDFLNVEENKNNNPQEEGYKRPIQNLNKAEQDWYDRFDKAKAEGNRKEIQSLYDKLKVALNGLTESQALKNLKEEIENYGASVREQSQKEGVQKNAENNPTTVQPTTTLSDNEQSKTTLTEEVIPTSNKNYSIIKKTNDKGTSIFEFRNNKTGKIVTQSEKTRKKYLMEWMKSQTFPETEISEGATNRDADEIIRKESNNPVELVIALLNTEKYLNDNGAKEYHIATTARRVSRDSFINASDKNNITIGLANAYFEKKEKVRQGSSIDSWAYAASESFAKDYGGDEITHQDIVDFMLDYKNGPEQYLRQINPDYKATRDRFYEITGLNPTDSVISELLNRNDSPQDLELKKRAEEYYEKLPLEQQDNLEKEYNDWFKSLSLEEQQAELIKSYPYEILTNEKGEIGEQSQSTDKERQSSTNANDKGRTESQSKKIATENRTNSPEYQQLLKDREAQEARVKSAKEKLDTVNKTTNQNFQQDQENLFGERQTDGGMFDERADGNAGKTIIAEAKAEYDKERNELTRINNAIRDFENGKASGTGAIDFQTGNQRFTPLTKEAFQKLIDRLQKAFPKFAKVTTDWNNFLDKAKSLGLNVNFDANFQIENKNPLIVIHNISERGLANVLNIGGLPVPSLAITSANNTLSSFGEITLIGDPYLADPKQPANKVFDTDVYSPRYPRSQKSFKSISEQRKFEKEILDLANQNEKSKFTYVDIEDALNDMRSDQIMTAYMVDQNIPFPESKYGNGAREYFYNTDGAEQALKDWVDEKTSNYNIEDKIFNGYTPSGNRKYIPHNLENVVKLLKGKIKNGENFSYGAGNIRASASKQFKSIEDVKKDRNKIVSKQDIENLKKETENDLSDLLENLKDNYRFEKNSFSYYDEAAASIGEFAGGKKNALSDTFENLSNEQINLVKDYILKLKNAPTEYFEAKPQRAVNLREFKAAVVPKGTSQKILDQLKQKGITIYEYDSKVDGDRQQKVNQASSEQDVQFMHNANGTVYGAKLPDGTIYINPQYLNANTPIHEFSHLWEQLLPKAWAKGLEIFKQTKTGKDSHAKLKQEGNYANLTDEQLWSEALNTHIGNYGEWRSQNPRGKMKELADWLKNLFNRLGDFFGIKINPETKLKDFTEGVVGDLLGGKELVTEVGSEANNSVNYNIVNKSNPIPKSTIANVLESSSSQEAFDKLKESNWYKNLNQSKKDEINVMNWSSAIRESMEIQQERDKAKVEKAKEKAKVEIKNIKEETKDKINELKKKYAEEIQKIKFGSKARTTERIDKIRNVQKKAYQDITDIITSDKLQRNITPSETNRLIKAAFQILNSNNTQKAIDNFIELYEKVNISEYQKHLDNNIKYVQKISQDVKDAFADGKSLQEIYDENPKKYESARAKELARKVYDREVSKNNEDKNALSKLKDRQQQVKDATYKSPKLKEVIRNIGRGFIREVSDRQFLPKNILKNINAKATYNRIISYGGASASAKARWEKIDKAIFANMTNKDRDYFNIIVQQRRIISIDENRESRGLEPVNHPDNANQFTAQNALTQMKLELGQKKFDELNKKADLYFEAFKDLLSDMKKNGIINQAQYDSMADVDYQPRQFMEHLFDMEYDADNKLVAMRPISGEKFGNSTGLSKDQIRSLEEGSMGLLMDDAMLLLSNAILGRTKSFFINNVNKTFINKDFPKAKTDYETLKSKDVKDLTREDKRFIKYFEELQSYVKENPMVGFTPSGKPKFKYEDLPSKGWKRAYYFENGIRKEFFMRDDFYEQWHDTMNKFIDGDAKDAVSVVTGSAITKMMATGRNPGFALVNTPRDFGSVMLFSEEYSNIAPVSFLQLAKDSVKSIADIYKHNNSNKETLLSKYLEYGGGMDFLNTEGETPMLGKLSDRIVRLFNKNNGINNKTKTISGSIFDAVTLKLLSQYSETMFRVAVFDRSIQNQLKDLKVSKISDLDQETQDEVYTQAVVSARKVMDFNQGGRTVKALETVIPYINAATQGSRVLADSIRERPYATTARLLQGATVTASLGYAVTMALISAFKDDDDDRKPEEIYLDMRDGLSPFQKRGYIHFTTGKKNAEGEMKTWKIAVAQPLTPFFTMATNIFDDVIRMKLGRKQKGIGYVFDEAQEAFSANVDPFGITEPSKLGTKNPIIKALVTYESGFDFFRDQPLDKNINKVPLALEGRQNKRVEDFYKAWGLETGMSPVRTKAAIEAMITSPDTNPFIAMTYGSIDAIVGYDSGFNEKKGFLKTVANSFERRLNSETSDANRLLNQLSSTDLKEIEKKVVEDKLIDEEADKIMMRYKSPERILSAGEEINQLIKKKDIPQQKKIQLVERIVQRITDFETTGGGDPKIWFIKYNTYNSAPAKAEAVVRIYGKDFQKDSKVMQSLLLNKVLTDDVWIELNQKYKVNRQEQ